MSLASTLIGPPLYRWWTDECYVSFLACLAQERSGLVDQAVGTPDDLAHRTTSFSKMERMNDLVVSLFIKS
jgi:hypothetical protein